MEYLEPRIYAKQYPAAHLDITTRLKARAGQIISRALIIEHVPQSAREVMANPVVHKFVRSAFRDVVVDCLAAYFDRLEESRTEVLEEVVRRTRSKYGTRLRLVQSAMERTERGVQYRNVLDELYERVTPELYGSLVAVVRQEYARQ